MTQLILDFNDFMRRDFRSLSIGLTPSGNIHLGFLVTLSCALLYLREHPKAHLIITSVENSLSQFVDKYNNYPLRFQYLENGQAAVPEDLGQFHKRHSIAQAVMKEVNTLIWQLVSILDQQTQQELRRIKDSFILPKDKKWLRSKENKVFHLFGTQIYIYDFLDVLQRDKTFRARMAACFAQPLFAQAVAPMAMAAREWRWRKTMKYSDRRDKVYPVTSYKVPLRLYCPTCKRLCPDWAQIFFGHPQQRGPTLGAPCENQECPKAQQRDPFVYQNLKEDLAETELHFMLNSMRDFFDPFYADCHVFGGDYFQVQYSQGVTAIDKIKPMFDYLEAKTKQQKSIFGGPLITMGDRKMSKSGTTFRMNEMEKIRPVFQRIIYFLEEMRAGVIPTQLRLDYQRIIGNAA